MLREWVGGGKEEEEQVSLKLGDSSASARRGRREIPTTKTAGGSTQTFNFHRLSSLPDNDPSDTHSTSTSCHHLKTEKGERGEKELIRGYSVADNDPC